MKALKTLVLIILAVTACSRSVEVPQLAEKKVSVKVQNPVYMEFSDPVRASGILSTRVEMKLSFKTGGIIKSINVREGQSVNKGDILASLDLSEINAQVNQAGIAFEKSRRDYNRALNLYKDSVATLETLQNAKSAYDLAKSQKRVAEFNLKHSRIIAPGKGKVQKILLEKNEMIAPGYPAILFATTESDWVVRVSLTDKDIVRFTVGDSAKIQMDAFPGIEYSAFISELGTFADPVLGTYEVELQLKDVNEMFRTGFIARANLYPSDTTAGWWLPFESVQDMDRDEGYVYILDSLHVYKQDVRLGKIIGDGILISSGVDADDMVVREGAAYVKDGAEVQLISMEIAE